MIKKGYPCFYSKGHRIPVFVMKERRRSPAFIIIDEAGKIRVFMPVIVMRERRINAKMLYFSTYLFIFYIPPDV